ncbi:MAG: LysM peptidoglycan-binding domain-containing protein [Actinomycetes bacterium]
MSKTLAVSLCSAIMLGVVGVPGALAESNKKTTSSSSASATTGLTYVVAKNDSLTGIASKTKVKFNDLLDVNGFQATSVILPGQVIVLPDAAVAVVAASNVAPAVAVPSVVGGSTYTVAKNDSLSGIASKAKVTFAALLAVNGFTKTSVILPGQVVKLPEGAKVTVASSTPATPSRLQVVLDFAKAQVGKPYEFGKAGPTSYDCSGLTMAAYGQVKVSLPHQSLAQSKLGSAVDWRLTGVQAGDLVFTFSSRNPTQISHVGIAISATQWIEAPYTGGLIRISSLPSVDRIQAVRRVL